MSSPKYAVDCRWLLALYAIIPISVGVVVLDILLLEGELLNSLPTTPDRWPFWTVVFGLPHIIASLLTMADREYIDHYRQSLFWPLVVFAGIAALGTLGPQPLSYNLLFIFIAFYTIYHVLAQQLGLTLMMMGTPPTSDYHWWKWLSIIAGFAIYINVYGKGRLGYWQLGPFYLYELLAALAAGLCVAVIFYAVRLTPVAKNRLGVWYLWANVALVLSAFAVNEVGYTLLVILMPRIVHDLTAYTVYITHDSNRNRERPVNLVYRLTHFTRLPPILLLPLVSLGIAYLLTSQQNYAAISIIIVTVSLMHYYYEGFIWRGPNPHRGSIAFKR